MSVAHITIREHGAVPDGAATKEHMDVQELCVTGPAAHWMWHSGELALLSRQQQQATLWRSGLLHLANCLGSTVKLVLVAGCG